LGIVGSGLDVIYPQRHARLWHQVATSGGLVSEAPMGAAPEAWRFPWRNRLIAALSDVVVVVESHRAGGALLTVEAAMLRGVSVLAVPGSVRSPASVGTNALIADGCAPARDVDDILVALGLSRTQSRSPLPQVLQQSNPGAPGSIEEVVWASLDSDPTPTDAILARTGLPLGEVAAALDHLAETGWVKAGHGWWRQVLQPVRGSVGD
jgi:DNA processing protein